MASTFDAGAIILAGGESRRMGRDKSLLPIQGVPLIQHIARQLQPHFVEVIVVTNSPASYPFLDLPLVPDLEPGQGPLMGIASGLARARHEWNLVVPTDMPTIPLGVLRELFAHTGTGRCVVPCERDGRPQPLFGLYHRELRDELLAILAAGERRVLAILDQCAPTMITIDTGQLANLNTPEAYETFGR